jgi:hypothetical protein
MVIRVLDVATAADTAVQGTKLYRKLAEALKSEPVVIISFAGIRSATSSFANTSFGQILTLITLDDVKRRIKVIDSTKQINDMIRRVLLRETV